MGDFHVRRKKTNFRGFFLPYLSHQNNSEMCHCFPMLRLDLLFSVLQTGFNRTLVPGKAFSVTWWEAPIVPESLIKIFILSSEQLRRKFSALCDNCWNGCRGQQSASGACGLFRITARYPCRVFPRMSPVIWAALPGTSPDSSSLPSHVQSRTAFPSVCSHVCLLWPVPH